MINENISKLQRITNYDSRKKYLRLDMNENPSGLPESFVQSVLKSITPGFLSTYPNCYDFMDSYSRYLGLNFENVLPTNGSDMAIRLIFDTFVNPGSTVLGVSPSFEMYRINAEMHGASYKGVRYRDDLSFDEDLFLTCIDSSVSLVVLLNPNNPVGSVHPRDFVINVIEKARNNGAIVLIDEAYHYYTETTYVDLVKDYDNVIVTRTFSKMFSMAALRLGVAISCKRMISLLFNSQPSFDVNSVALLFGQRIIESPELIGQLIDEYAVNRRFIEGKLEEHGYQYLPSSGNFILIHPHNISPYELKRRLSKSNILIKTYAVSLLASYFRIHVCSIEDASYFFGELLKNDVA